MLVTEISNISKNVKFYRLIGWELHHQVFNSSTQRYNEICNDLILNISTIKIRPIVSWKFQKVKLTQPSEELTTPYN